MNAVCGTIMTIAFVGGAVYLAISGVLMSTPSDRVMALAAAKAAFKLQPYQQRFFSSCDMAAGRDKLGVIYFGRKGPCLVRGKSATRIIDEIGYWPAKPDLTLVVRTAFFLDIVAGRKPFEYRLDSDYWRSRLLDKDGNPREFGRLVIINAYRAGAKNRIVLPWRGFERQCITHPHFGAAAVDVFAIRCDTKGGR